MTLVLMLVFAISIVIGMPVALAIALGCLCGFLSNGTIPLMALPQRIVMGLDSFPMLAIPLFVMAGDLMNSAGITKRLINLSQRLVGHISGSLAQVGFLTNIFMACISGSGLASAAATGSVLIPEMKEKGYSKGFSATVIAAAATIGPIIPPSVPLVLYGSIAEVSVGRLFLGGAIPGLIMGISMMFITYFIARKRGYGVSPKASPKEIFQAIMDALLALLAPIAIVGGIISGWATATESAVIAVWISILLGVFVYKELTFQKIIAAATSSMVTTGTICFIIAASAPFGWIMAWENVPTRVLASMEGIMHIPWLVLLLVMLCLLVLGMFLDGTPIIILTTPILLPVMKQIGVDPVHYGVILAINTMVGTITPPVGTLMYVTTRIAGCSIAEFSKEAWKYMLLLAVVLLAFAYIPPLVTWLPGVLMPM
ncbi:TRAP transporter large permease [Anaerotruncus rubiinfantis]|uniref:TRAP transporter large permease n=1 Tax=Anaerotruncus rubiinfantis TaxID=1720200 RepID=UPI00189A8454|nr:TRAP transporter large permease [Anaerotruncus rubiinfantis]